MQGYIADFSVKLSLMGKKIEILVNRIQLLAITNKKFKTADYLNWLLYYRSLSMAMGKRLTQQTNFQSKRVSFTGWKKQFHKNNDKGKSGKKSKILISNLFLKRLIGFRFLRNVRKSKVFQKVGQEQCLSGKKLHYFWKNTIYCIDKKFKNYIILS